MSSAGIHVITDGEIAEFTEFVEANPRLAYALPVTLPSGFKVEEFHPVCSKCRGDIPANWAWLHRVRHEFGQNTVEVWDVRGLCKPCRTMTPCYLRFRSDGTYDTLVDHQWRHGSLGGHDKRTRSRVKTIVRRILRWPLIK